MRQEDPGSPEVFVANEQEDIEVDERIWQEFALAVLREISVVGNAELSIFFVTEDAIAALNRQFMSKTGPTDVLSFPIAQSEEASGRLPDSGGTGPDMGAPRPPSLPYLLGDVVIAPAVAARQAGEHVGDRGHRGTLEDEIALLIVHGILHIRGMDHEDDAEAVIMEAKEDDILSHIYRPVAVDSSLLEGEQSPI